MAHHNKIGDPSTRRQMIAGGAFGLAGLTIGSAGASAQETAIKGSKPKAILMAKAIHQEEDFKAGPGRIYELLLDDKQFRAFSRNRAAEIHREAGGAFSLFDGHIVGRNLELLSNRRIVQAWRATSWPEGVYSIASFLLLAQGPGTRVVLDHTGFPSELAEGLESGWHENYWQPLREYLS